MIGVVRKRLKKGSENRGKKCTIWCLFLRTFFLILIIPENLFENEKEHYSKTEQVMVLEKVEGQLLYCINSMNNDEAV